MHTYLCMKTPIQFSTKSLKKSLKENDKYCVQKI